MELSREILQRAEYWSNCPDFDSDTRAEVGGLLATAQERELADRFYRDLAFGTGGMRGIMGAGTSRMNVYNIRKATTALAMYLLEVHQAELGGVSHPPSAGSRLQVAIAYDSRHKSRFFAECAASVLAAHGIAALITAEMRPVPMLSFMVRHFNCQAGICITASHNPPEYNGFKVYWATGGQLVPPHDAGITAYYKKLTDYHSLASTDFASARAAGLIREIASELDDAYFAKIEALSLQKGGREGFRIVYSPIHGTGIYAVPTALRRFGFRDILIPPAQEHPDGSFPTVRSPNPEDPAALAMALSLAEQTRADLVLATDPDTDRIGLIVREGEVFRSFNGNQLGCLLMDYVLAGLQQSGRLPDKPLVIKTIVTTDLQQEIAAYYGAACEETLTGFKWICQLIEDYEQGVRTPYREFVCGGEESYGFLAGTFVRDKDAIIACALAAEMVAYYKSIGLSLSMKLDEIFSRHAVYEESLLTLTLPGKEGAERIAEIMKRFRDEPPAELGGERVCQIFDYEWQQLKERGPSSSSSWQVVRPLELPASDVLQFVLADGSKVSIRPSGTEPKIKAYISVSEPSKGATGQTLARLKEHVHQRVAGLEAEMTALITND